MVRRQGDRHICVCRALLCWWHLCTLTYVNIQLMSGYDGASHECVVVLLVKIAFVGYACSVFSSIPV